MTWTDLGLFIGAVIIAVHGGKGVDALKGLRAKLASLLGWAAEKVSGPKM